MGYISIFNILLSKPVVQSLQVLKKGMVIIMKVLILSCIMGEGHNTAANAVSEFLQTQNIECEILDTLTLAGKNASEKANNAYLMSTRLPLVFRFTYFAGKMISSPKRKSPVYYKNRSYRNQLFDYIQQNGFDTIITTHLFPAEALTALKRENRLTASTIGILTDYTCSPFWVETELDYYIIPHKDLTNEFIKKGIQEAKILPYGIPVKQSFYQKLPKEDARNEINQRYDLTFDISKPFYMIMSGSMGFGKIGLLVNAIVQVQKEAVNIIIVCGNNRKLKKHLSMLFNHSKNVAVLGFVKEVSLLMDGCDVIFTKPGGLSSTEAAIKNIPIIHTAPIPGCEIDNAAFFSDHGMSYRSNRIIRQLHNAKMLCCDPAYREYMVESQKENMSYHSCELIYETLCSLDEAKRMPAKHA